MLPVRLAVPLPWCWSDLVMWPRRAVASYAETDIRRVGIRAHARGEHGEMSVARELRKDLVRVIRGLLTAA